MHPTAARLLLASSLLLTALTASPRAFAGASTGQLHTIFFQQDTSIQPQMDEMFGCLAASSTFGGAWAQQFGLQNITYEGSIVLTQASPAQLVLGGNLDQLVADAMSAGLVPPPVAGIANEYLVYVPQGVAMSDSSGQGICDGSGVCAEHGTTYYGNQYYDLAIVPIGCPECGAGLDAASIGGEHEAAEGLADQGTATYEVGDGCETDANTTQLSCCGQVYDIQQLAGAGGYYDCQTITATGNACGCAKLATACKQDAECCAGTVCRPYGGGGGQACCNDTGASCAQDSDCCGGLACNVESKTCERPAVDAGSGSSSGGSASSSGSGGASGSGGGDIGGSGSSGGSGGGSGGGASQAPDGGANDDGGNADDPGLNAGAAGCGCREAGGDKTDRSTRIIAVMCALLVVARRMRRSDARP